MQEPAQIPTTRRSGRSPAPPVRQTDALTRWLQYAIIGVVILGLASFASALMFGVFNTTGAPRTDVERQMTYYSSLVASGKANGETVATYVAALRQAGQLDKAQDTLNEALRTAKSQRSYLLAEQAQLDLANKRFQDTITDADKAMAEAKKELEAYKVANVAANRRRDAGAQMPDSFTTAALAKALALMGEQKYADAVKTYDSYLQVSPIDSDVLVLRAEAKRKLGDTAGATADYRTALKYVPDYQPAIDGLKQIGASK